MQTIIANPFLYPLCDLYTTPLCWWESLSIPATILPSSLSPSPAASPPFSCSCRTLGSPSRRPQRCHDDGRGGGGFSLGTLYPPRPIVTLSRMMNGEKCVLRREAGWQRRSLLVIALTACCAVVGGEKDGLSEGLIVLSSKTAGLVVSTTAHDIDVQYMLRINVEVAVCKEEVVVEAVVRYEGTRQRRLQW